MELGEGCHRSNFWYQKATLPYEDELALFLFLLLFPPNQDLKEISHSKK